MRNVSIKKKLLFCVGIVFVLCVTVVTLSYISMQKAIQYTTDINDLYFALDSKAMQLHIKYEEALRVYEYYNNENHEDNNYIEIIKKADPVGVSISSLKTFNTHVLKSNDAQIIIKSIDALYLKYRNLINKYVEYKTVYNSISPQIDTMAEDITEKSFKYLVAHQKHIHELTASDDDESGAFAELAVYIAEMNKHTTLFKENVAVHNNEVAHRILQNMMSFPITIQSIKINSRNAKCETIIAEIDNEIQTLGKVFAEYFYVDNHINELCIEIKDIGSQLNASTSELVSFSRSIVQKAFFTMTHVVRNNFLIIITMVICLSSALFAALILVYKNIIALLNIFGTTTESFKNGDFSQRIHVNRHDEIADVANNINYAFDIVIKKIYWYESILDSIQSPICVTDVHRTVTFINTARCKFLSKNREECIGKNVYSVNEECKKVQSCAIQMLYNNISSCEVFIDGSYYSIHSAFMRDMSGDITGHIEIMTDVSTIKEISNTLYQYQKQLHEIIESIPTVLCQFDLDGKLVLYNNTFSEALGGNEHAHGKTFLEFEHNNSLWCVHYAVMECIEKESRIAFEHEYMHADGSVHTYLSNVISLVREGEIYGVLAVGTDITEQKNLQRELQAATHAKSLFLSTMSHEIRTPMNAIIGFINLFERKNLTEKQSSYLQKIHVACNTLLQLINAILDISKIESGKLQVECIPLDLYEIMDNLHSIIGGTARDKGLEFSIHIEDSVPRQFMGDPTRLHQVLLNLVSNAIKFTPHGTVAVHVALQPATPEDSTAPACVCFSVTDSGIGMSEQQRAVLFAPFTQADSSTTRQYGGTGLGLAISKQLVELMGGEMFVTSVPEQGSTFAFTLTVQAVADVATTAAGACHPLPGSSDDPMRYSGHVLVVEDNEINQEIAQAMLENVGLSVDMANHGQQALTMVQERQYHMIFMDIQMPIMDGLEATRCIRRMGRELDAFSGLATIPIVALTANAMAEDRTQCLKAGMTEYLSKPFSQADLCAVLDRSLTRQ